MSPRIAVISQQYGTLGGGEIFAREVTERIARRGRFQMHVFSRKWKSDCREIVFHRVPTWGVPRQLLPTAFAWLACRMARSGRFDLVHAQSRCSDADIFSVHWCPHAFWVREILHRPPRWSDRLRMRIDARMIQNASDRVFLPNSLLQQEIFNNEYGRCSGRWRVVHPGVDGARLAPEILASQRAAARQECGLAEGDLAVLFVGMAWESKGLARLIRALGLIRDDPIGQRLRLLVVGRGDEARYDELATKSGVGNAIIFVGAHQRGVERFFAAADLFAMAASHENFSMATLEAMTAGLPVIISDRMGVRDLVQEGRNGSCLPDHASDNRWSECLLEWAHRVVRGELVNAQFSEKRDWDAVADEIVEEYERLLAKR